MDGFLSPSLAGLVLLLVGGAMTLAAAIGFGSQPNRRSAIAVVVFGVLSIWGWLLVRG